ncbi:ankyrin repeat and SOCS box protein 2-like [Alosa alosa]|uniref:ankyrin repeat and SOCS box protein 2-like n=1 Tax=Alosa alosa TaxID=278164 RepID=UPI0020153776|nr:ankyrin repeat and SOCS box protein 2-like [Alosa alosa]XP_048106949.1 ankyrin repeat and SOCS box protein 2-like [Alosa alosa]XP_048106950.1 ankyrin repeat and SOCS box protein 2-like [Alosa alosa]XP_048106951.1 ankyrin repeat and SOCS box protein 2-like [Alosa alosa]
MTTMAAASTADQAFEDYSNYSGLSDAELIQLSIERSLSDIFSPSSEHSQRSSCSLAAASQPMPFEHETMPTLLELQQENHRALRQTALHTRNIPPAANPHQTANHPSQNRTESSHNSAEDGARVCSWTKSKTGGLQVRLKPMDMSAIQSAIWRNDAPKLLEVLQEQPSDTLSTPNKKGWIHLHDAANNGYEKCLRVLIKAFPKLINKRTNKRQTPLMLAAAGKNPLCVQYLLEAGADPNTADNVGESPLYTACENATEEIVELLLRFGAKASQANAKGMTPLHEAVRHKSLGMCKLLVTAGANIRARNTYGIEPLFMAAQGGGTEVLNLLIKHGAYTDCQTRDGATPLFEASKNGHEEVVRLLLSKRVNVNKTTNAGLTPLHIASKNGHARIVSLLIPKTARVIVPESGISPLHLAAEHDREDVLEILIDAGFDVNTLLKYDHSQIYDDRCCSALHFTVRNSNIDTASMLLEAGADPNLDAFNPLLLAVRQGNLEMVSLLVEYGANVNACVPTLPTTFPGALLFCMKHTLILKFLLDNGCFANACFSCVYGSSPHPPIKSRLTSRDELDLDEIPQSEAAQFCEIIADPLYIYWAGPILDRLLDYTGPVKLCSRITELLESNKEWVYIKEKSKPSFCLMHLCRLRIRQLVGWQRLRRMSSLPLPGRLIKYLFYDNGESENLYSYFFD